MELSKKTYRNLSFCPQEGAAMPKVANYFVRPEGVTLSLATVKDVQYGEDVYIPKHRRGGSCVFNSYRCHLR